MGLASEEHPLITVGLRPLRCGSEQVIQKDQLSQKERIVMTRPLGFSLRAEGSAATPTAPHIPVCSIRKHASMTESGTMSRP